MIHRDRLRYRKTKPPQNCNENFEIKREREGGTEIFISVNITKEVKYKFPPDFQLHTSGSE